jgi:hypothetical protein
MPIGRVKPWALYENLLKRLTQAATFAKLARGILLLGIAQRVFEAFA